VPFCCASALDALNSVGQPVRGMVDWLARFNPAAFRVATRDAVRVTSFPRPTSIAAGADAIATFSSGDTGSRVRVYRY